MGTNTVGLGKIIFKLQQILCLYCTNALCSFVLNIL